jgi:hypothetical protein
MMKPRKPDGARQRHAPARIAGNASRAALGRRHGEFVAVSAPRRRRNIAPDALGAENGED